MKIIDFGLAAVLDENQPEEISTKLGTRGYQPPEMVSDKTTCKNSDCDVFASGVVLFMMLIMSQPFENASMEDGNYRAIIKKQWERYWKVFISSDMRISPDFKHLVQLLLEPNPDARLKMKQIMSHDWMQLPLPKPDYVRNEMHKRKMVI